MSNSGIEWVPLNIPIHRRLEVLAAAFWSTYLTLGELISLYVFIKWLYSGYWWAAILYGVWTIYDIDTPRKGGRKQEWLRNWSLWIHYNNYFSSELIKTAELDPSKNYLMGVFPHGILGYGLIAAFGNNNSSFKKLFPGMVSHPLTIAGHFLVPFFRELILLLGLCSCSKESLLHLLDRRIYKGKCLGLLVGGAAEVMNTELGKDKAYVKSRKGFIRVAFEAGAPLVPVYVFGETDTYEVTVPPKGGPFERVQKFLKNTIGAVPMIMKGRGLFQYSFGLIPKRARMTIVVGAPIEVPMKYDPTAEEVDAVHETFLKALVDLFETHKHKYAKNPENARLELL